MIKKTKVFIDGSHGTTGLGILNELKGNDNYTILTLPHNKSKNANEKITMYKTCDITILCLPDKAAMEAAKIINSLTAKEKPKILDASSAHRANKNWTYGFAEMPSGINTISLASKVSNPGCYAIAFISIIMPLVLSKTISKNFPYTAFGASGYSGGGKKLINKIKKGFTPLHSLYSLNLQHKHLPEMKKYAGLTKPPIFQPLVINKYSGMVLSVVFPNKALSISSNGSAKKNNTNIIFNSINNYYKKVYATTLYKKKTTTLSSRISVTKFEEDVHLKEGFLPFSSTTGSNELKIIVAGNYENTIVHANLCNLGIGASGNAINNLNIMSGNI